MLLCLAQLTNAMMALMRTLEPSQVSNSRPFCEHFTILTLTKPDLGTCESFFGGVPWRDGPASAL